MKVLWTLPCLLPVLVSAEFRTVTGLPRSQPIALWTLAGLFLCLVIRPVEGDSRGPGRRLSLACVLGALLASAVLPSPCREAAWAVAGAYALAGAGFRGSAGVCVFSLSALTATLAHWLLPILMVRWQSDAALAEMASGLLRWFGVVAPATERGVGFSPNGVATLELGLSLGHWGARELLSLLVGSLVAVASGRSLGLGRRDLRAFLVALVCGTLVHLLVNAITLLETHEPGLLIDPWKRSLSIGIPMIWCLAYFSRRPDGRRVREDPGRSPAAPLLTFTASSLGVVLLVVSAFWPGVGERREGRIAIDEGHSFWERLDVPLDRDTMGTLAVYNYADWVRGLERLHGAVERLQGPLSPQVLSEFNVLILKTPTTPYTNSEVNAIHEFVEQGGGLYLVGDHNDVFGMNTILNSVAREYGIEYRPDALHEIDYKGGQVAHPRSLPPHPLTRTMKPMHFMTSCSIAVSGGARPLLWMNNGFADDPDYSRNNFIGDGELVGAEPMAPLAQLVTASAGRGKVLAFTDSTLFSNFSIFFPGVRELAFSGVEWLLWSERFPLWSAFAAWLGLVLFVGGTWTLRHHGLTWGASVVAGLGVGLFVAERGSAGVLSAWSQRLDKEEVVFDTALSGGRLPIWHESHDLQPDNFWGLFIAFQRGGDFMRVALDEDELLTGKAAVFIWPKSPLPSTFMDRAKDYVAGGGVLYVFDDRLATGSATNRLLEPFGLQMALPGAGRRLARPRGGIDPGPCVTLRSSAVVFGGESCYLDSEGDPLVARAEYGRGLVVAAGVAEDLSGSSLGSPSELRGMRAVDLLQLLYTIIDAARKNDSVGVLAP